MLKQIRIPLIIAGIAVLAIGTVFALQSRIQNPKPTPTTSLTMPASVRSIDHMWGEPAKAMFPDIEKPVYVGTKEASSFLRDDDLIMDVVFGQTHYMYPINILSFHHIVNDTIDGKPIAVTFCLLSDSALVFSRMLGNDTVDLGVLGPLYYGNLVMYDKKTDSYIIQMTGEIFHGPLFGKKLAIATSSTITAWKYVKDRMDAKVLSPEKPIAFYRDFYDTRKGSQMGLQSLTQKGGKPDSRLYPYNEGIGITNKGENTYVPISILKDTRQLRVSIGGDKLYIYMDPTDAITISGGTSLTYTPVYWFSWSAFYPQTRVGE